MKFSSESCSVIMFHIGDFSNFWACSYWSGDVSMCTIKLNQLTGTLARCALSESLGAKCNFHISMPSEDKQTFLRDPNEVSKSLAEPEAEDTPNFSRVSLNNLYSMSMESSEFIW